MATNKDLVKKVEQLEKQVCHLREFVEFHLMPDCGQLVRVNDPRYLGDVFEYLSSKKVPYEMKGFGVMRIPQSAVQQLRSEDYKIPKISNEQFERILNNKKEQDKYLKSSNKVFGLG